jgi:hypothetical protein
MRVQGIILYWYQTPSYVNVVTFHIHNKYPLLFEIWYGLEVKVHNDRVGVYSSSNDNIIYSIEEFDSQHVSLLRYM